MNCRVLTLTSVSDIFNINQNQTVLVHGTCLEDGKLSGVLYDQRTVLLNLKWKKYKSSTLLRCEPPPFSART